MNVPPVLPPQGPPPLPPLQRVPPPLPVRGRAKPKHSLGRRIARWMVWGVLLGVVLYRVFVFRPEPQFRQANQGGNGWPGQVWGGGDQRGRERRESWRAEGRNRKPQSTLPTNLWRIELELTPKAESALRQHQQQFRGHGQLEVTERPEVMLTVREGGRVYTNVAAHLKGAAGSFRPYDDTPAFTLNFSKHVKGQRFHGYSKISLNNSVQDPTLINEMLSREIFVAAGVPAPRAHHGTVVVNGRDLGLYVVLEGWGKPFLKEHFEDVSGNLYDGGFVQDIDGELSVVSGEDQLSHPGLERLRAAVYDEDRTKRWKRLSEALDVDRFVTLLALDMMLCNWDGYAMNRNNWRVFHDRSKDRMVFMPHGLDQLFGMGRRMGVDATIEPQARGMVARVLMSTPEARKLYRARVAELNTNVFNPDRLEARIREIAATIRPTLEAYHPGLADAHDRRVADLIARVQARSASITQQLARPSSTLKFAQDGTARPSAWRPAASEAGGAEFLRRSSPKEVLVVRVRQGEGAGSWRARVNLAEGVYRLEGSARVAGALGAGYAQLRVSGVRGGFRDVSGGAWVPLEHTFACEGPITEVDLVADAEGSQAEVEFDLSSLRLVRIEQGRRDGEQ